MSQSSGIADRVPAPAAARRTLPYFWPSPIRRSHKNNGRWSSLDLTQLLSCTPLLLPSSSSHSRSRCEPVKRAPQRESHRVPKRPMRRPLPSENLPEQEPRQPRTPRSKRRPNRRKPERKLDRGQSLAENRKGHAVSLAHRACSSNTDPECIACKLQNLR